MQILFGAAVTAGGLFLFLWYRTLVALPQRKRPGFSVLALFKWGLPTLSVVVFAGGLWLLARTAPVAAVTATLLAVLLGGALLRFDRYSATMRIIHDSYRGIREAPGMSEPDALFLTARRRYPDWSGDRVLELVAAKDVESVILLMVIQENGIHPIADWDLYRSLRSSGAEPATGTE